MTALRAGNGGTHGSRPTGCGGHTGRTGSSAPTTGRRGRRALQNLSLRGAQRRGNPFSPCPKRRIPTPVCTPRALASRRALARNDSAVRWERRDTWVPPYGVRQSSRADRVVRPYKAEQEPRKAGRRGRRPLHTLSLRGAKRRGNPFSPAQRDGFPRQCAPQGHLLRGVHWRGMTALRAGNGGTHGSRATGCGGHPGRAEASAPTRQNRNRAKRDDGDGVPYE